MAVRGGDVVGDHTAYFFGQESASKSRTGRIHAKTRPGRPARRQVAGQAEAWAALRHWRPFVAPSLHRSNAPGFRWRSGVFRAHAQKLRLRKFDAHRVAHSLGRAIQSLQAHWQHVRLRIARGILHITARVAQGGHAHDRCGPFREWAWYRASSRSPVSTAERIGLMRSGSSLRNIAHNSWSSAGLFSRIRFSHSRLMGGG